MIKFIIAIIACVSFSGCVAQRADSFDLHRAVAFCGSLENIANIVVFFDGGERVVCMDSSQSMLGAVKGPTK